MALGKEIKVVLSLDDNGFSVKVRKAKGETQDLAGSLTDLSKSANTVDSSLDKAGAGIKGFGDSFGALQKSITSTMDTLQKGVLSSFDGISRAARDSTTDAQKAATAQIDAKKRVLQNEIDVNKKLIESRAKTFNDLRKAQNDANTRALQANMQKDARMQAYMSAPIGSSLANRANMTADVAALNQQIALHEHNATVIGLEAIKVGEWITAERQANIVRQESVAAMNAERAAALRDVAAKEQLAKVAAAVGASNDKEIQRVKAAALARDKATEKERTQAARDSAGQVRAYNREVAQEELENQRMIRQAAIETARIKRQEAAETARQQKQEAQATAQMWKGMAQAYGGARVMGGLGASIKEGDDYERIVERMNAMNIDGAQGRANTLNIAKNVQEQNPNLSKTEALKVTLATTAGAVSTDPEVVGKIAPEIAKFTTVMTRLFPDQAHNVEQFTQNMMGVMEARGIARDPEKMITALDSLSRALILTQGKITVQDYETLSRRGGAGNAQLKNDESILYDVAAASQLKSMGGGGGGGGGGVSQYATMMRQASKRVQGGVTEKRSALENLVEFGVIDKDELLQANGGKLGRNIKAVPYKDSDKAAENMTLFAMNFANKIKAKLAALPESDNRFFEKGADRKDDKQQAKAFGRWVDQSIGNTSAAEFYKLQGTEGSQERQRAEVSVAKQAPTVDEDQKKAMESWGGSTDRFTSSMKNLGNTIGTALIPILQPAVEWVTKLITSMNDFFQGHNIIAGASAVAAGFTGITMSVRGFASMFGALGLTKMLQSLMSVGSGLGAALTIPFVSAQSWSNFKAIISTFGTVFANLGSMLVGLMSKLPGMSSILGLFARSAGLARLGLAGMGMAVKNIGMIMVAWDIGYMIGTWASSVEVGALTIGEHMTNLFTKIEVGYKRLMLSTEGVALKVRNFLHIDSDDETAKGMSDLDKRKADLAKYEKVMTITDDDAKARRSAAAAAAAKAKQKADADKKAADEKSKADAKKARQLAAEQPDVEDDVGTVDTKGMFKNKDADRPDRDPLGAALANAEGKVNEQKEKLGAIIAGTETLASLERQAVARIEGKYNADEFSPLHDKNRRPAENDPRLVALKQRTFETLLLGEQVKALDFAQQRVAATTGEADAAMQRVADGSGPKQTDAFRALSRELERAEIRLGAGAQGFDRWAAAKTRALFEQSRADAGNYTADLHQQNDKSKLDLTDTDHERVEAEIALTRQTEEQKYQIRHDTQQKSYEDARAAAIKAAYAYGPPNKAALNEITRIDQENQASRDALDQEMAERRRLRLLEEARMRETAMQKQVREWKDVNKQVDDIGAKAGNNFVDLLLGGFSNGRARFGDFLKGILSDVANARAKQALADPVNSAVSQGTDWVKENVFGMKKAVADEAAATAASARASADTAATTAVGTMSTSIMGQVLPALQAFAASLAMSSSSNTAGGMASMFGGSSGGGGDDGGTDWGSIAMLAAETFMADGGVMTSMGQLPLRKYATGGIARSPQVTVFGEAGPEAYVPLPDGRSIPVTMKGGSGGQQQVAAPVVQVNVINQTSQSVNAQQNGAKFDGKQMILDVVLSAASSPGPFRAGMKDAMKGN